MSESKEGRASGPREGEGRAWKGRKARVSKRRGVGGAGIKRGRVINTIFLILLYFVMLQSSRRLQCVF